MNKYEFLRTYVKYETKLDCYFNDNNETIKFAINKLYNEGCQLVGVVPTKKDTMVLVWFTEDDENKEWCVVSIEGKVIDGNGRQFILFDGDVEIEHSGEE